MSLCRPPGDLPPGPELAMLTSVYHMEKKGRHPHPCSNQEQESWDGWELALPAVTHAPELSHSHSHGHRARSPQALTLQLLPAGGGVLKVAGPAAECPC